MKTFFLLIPFFQFFLFQNQAKAQTELSGRFNKVIFVEAFGQGLDASVNYDMRFKKGVQEGLGFRVGIGGVFAGSSYADAGAVAEGVLAFPLAVNYLIGQKRSALEAGLGFSPQRVRVDQLSPTKPRIAGDNGWGANAFFNLGYRYQPLKNGLVFRLDWTPLVGDAGFISRFGISAGYGFK